MPLPNRPPLNGRNLAEYYTSTEFRKRSVLREYAKPVDKQKARIILYDPVRRNLLEYFRSGRDRTVIDRAKAAVEARRDFSTPDYTELYRKSNRIALDRLGDLELNGTLSEARSVRSSITLSGVTVKSTADFVAVYTPRSARGKPKRVAVICNPSGIKRQEPARKTWVAIESEVAFRAANDAGERIEEVLYIDLARSEIHRHAGSKKRVWDEIDASCERIARDWRAIRIERSEQDESA